MFSTSSVSFTKAQLDAIRWERKDACVVAGPGSGKTTVLVERCRSLIVDHGFDPAHLLAITFTEKAAANMKAKLTEQFEHDPLRRRELYQAWVSTIHGFCARLLRENAIAAGIDPRFSVLDAREAEALQYECLNAALDTLTAERRDEMLTLIATLSSPGSLAGDLRTAYDAIRAAGLSVAAVRALPNPNPVDLTPQDLAAELGQILNAWAPGGTDSRRRLRGDFAEWMLRLNETPPGDLEATLALGKPPALLNSIPAELKPELKVIKEERFPALVTRTLDEHIAPFRALVFDALDRFETLYRKRKNENAALDFNDLERHAIDLLERDRAVASRVRSQFRQVLVDEFQDINEQQQKLIQLVRGEDVFFAVGDRNQSIYGFRHARPEIFQRYREEIERDGKHYVDLLENFRSRPEILACVETLLAEAEGVESRALQAAADFTVKGDSSIEILKVVPDEEDADDDEEKDDNREARWIAERILSLRGHLDAGKERKADFGDFAVLFRANDSMKPLLEVFDHARIPYVCGRRQSFLVSREGLDITALLAAIANPRDGIAVATVLRSELVGVSDDALLRARLLAGSLTSGLNTLAFDESQLAEFAPDDAQKLARFVRNLRRWRIERPVVSFDLLLVRALDDCGFAWTPGTQGGDNIESFLALARARSGRMTLERFLIDVESLTSAVAAESDLSDQDQGNRVQVMTMHAAKGLEFPVTILASLEKSARYGSPPVTFTPAHGLGLKWRDGVSDSWHAANKSVIEQREKEEANRLIYVAMTRAEQHLILSYTATKRTSPLIKRIEERAPVVIRTLIGDPELSELEAPQKWQREVAAIPAPAIGGQHDSAVNVTSLAAFADCPRRYYIERYIGWNGARKRAFDAEELPRDTDTPAAELGSHVHEMLAGKTDTRHSEEARVLADVFRNSAVGQRAASSPRQAREWEFIVDVSGTLVRGSVDLWFEEDGDVHIVDYKTDDIRAAECAARAARYRPQLALYALALERALGRRPSGAALHFLRPNVVIEVVIDDQTIGDAVGLVARLDRAQDRLEFDLNEGDHCRTCPNYRSLCPAGYEASI